MNRSKFLKAGLFSLGALAVSKVKAFSFAKPLAVQPEPGPFKLAPLPYAYAALEPHIDKQTMEIHHSKHHQTYVNNLNKALKGSAGETMKLEDILGRVTKFSPVVRNNGGGHWNHTFFWECMKTGGTAQVPENLLGAIVKTFGDLDSFKQKFSDAATMQFGSGWAWLMVAPDKSLIITSTTNQDNPLMDIPGMIKGTPILAIDVWEHAYYLKYQNKRADYIKAFWNVVDWDKVALRYAAAIK